MTDAGRQQNAHVLARQLVPELAQVHEAVHHLSDAETVTEVVERVVAVVGLNAQLHNEKTRPPFVFPTVPQGITVMLT